MKTDQHFVSHADGSVSYKLHGKWFKKVWAVPIAHRDAMHGHVSFNFLKHRSLYGWAFRQWNRLWYAAAPDHLARRVDSSD